MIQKNRAGPDAAGATRRTRVRPRCGWGHSISLLFSSEMSERAGRRPALAFRAQVGPTRCRRDENSFRGHGTDGKLSPGALESKRRAQLVASPFLGLSGSRTVRSPRPPRPLPARGKPRRRSRRAGEVLDRRLPAARLRGEIHQFALLGADADLDRKPKRLEVLRQRRVVCAARSGALSPRNENVSCRWMSVITLAPRAAEIRANECRRCAASN